MKVPLFLLLMGLTASPVVAGGRKLHITVLGDSLTAGYGLPGKAAFPVRLEAALQKRGFEVRVSNAGISGDTSAGGLARLDLALRDRPDLMIIELGINDALRGLDPQLTRQNLSRILDLLQERQISVLLTGMQAPRSLGAAYATNFNHIYPQLAEQFQVPLYPHFLDGVAGSRKLNQPDGLHPTADGVEVIVNRILPTVENCLQRLQPQATGTNSN